MLKKKTKKIREKRRRNQNDNELNGMMIIPNETKWQNVNYVDIYRFCSKRFAFLFLIYIFSLLFSRWHNAYLRRCGCAVVAFVFCYSSWMFQVTSIRSSSSIAVTIIIYYNHLRFAALHLLIPRPSCAQLAIASVTSSYVCSVPYVCFITIQ